MDVDVIDERVVLCDIFVFFSFFLFLAILFLLIIYK